MIPLRCIIAAVQGQPQYNTGNCCRCDSWCIYSRPIQSNKTEQKNESNPIELQSFDWVRQSNKIEHLFCCEFDFRTNRTNITKMEQNRTNPMQNTAIFSLKPGENKIRLA